MNIWALALVFGALHGYFLAGVLIFMKRGNRKANLCLSALVFIISLQLTASAGSITGLYHSFPHLMHVHTPFIFLIGALIYFYVRFSLSIKERFRPADALHLLPAAISIYSLSSFFFLSGSQKLSYLYMIPTASNNPAHLIMWNFYAALIFVYTLISARMLFKNNRALNNRFSETRRKHFRTLKVLLSIFASYVLVSFVLLFYLTFNNLYFPMLDFISLCIYALFIHTVAYMAMKEPDHLFLITPYVNGSHKGNPGAYAQKKPSLTGNRVESILQDLDELMVRKELYLECELKISTVAETLGIQTHILSQILNRELKLNFYDYVNRFRVKKAQERLLDPKYRKYTILGIALDTGFNSKASFNRIFKKAAGMTPSEFIKSGKPPKYNKTA